MKTRWPMRKFLPQSVVKGGNRRKESGTSVPVIRDIISTRSSMVVYCVFSSIHSLIASSASSFILAGRSVPGSAACPAFIWAMKSSVSMVTPLLTRQATVLTRLLHYCIDQAAALLSISYYQNITRWRTVDPIERGTSGVSFRRPWRRYRGSMDNREEIRAYHMSRREQVTPQEVGLPSGSNRRVKGLRRSEVAILAGVSVEYYTRLERGALSSASPEVLDKS